MANVIEIIIKQTGQGTAIADTSKALGSFKGVGDTAITALLGVGKALVGVGAIATTAIVGFAASGVKAAMDVDHQLAQIAATLGTTKEAAMPLKQLMTELALDPKLTVNVTQAGEAIEVLAANGLELQDILAGGARGAIQLANATGSDFATAATIATDAMQQFGFEANELGTVADGIAGVLVKSKFSADDYALALSNAGGIAGNLGVDFGDFNTVLAATSSFFSSGSDAGTSFKTLLTRLAKPTDDVKAAMEEFGLSIFDSAGQMLPFAEVAGQLNKVFKNLNESEKAELATRLGGTDAMRTILGLAGLTEEQFNALSAEVNQSGLAAQAAATRVDSLRGAWEIFKGIIEAVQIQVGDKFLPIIRRVTEAVSVWASENSGQIVAFFGVIAAGIDLAITKGTELFNAFQAGGTGGLMAAMGLTPEQIEMITSGFTLIMDNLEVFKGALIGIGAVVGAGIFVSLAAGIIALLTPINLLIVGAALLGAAWAGNWGNIQGITQQAFATITELFNQFMVIWTTNWPIIQAVALTAWEVLQGIFAGFQTALGPVLTQLNTQFTEVFGQISAILASFGISWSDVWNALLTATGIVAAGIGAIILGIIGVVVGLATGIAEGISAAITMFQNLSTNVAGIFTGLTTIFVGWVETFKALIAGDFAGALEGLKIVAQGVITFWSNMWGGMITVVVGTLDVLTSSVSGFVMGIVNFFKGMYNQLVGGSIVPDMINAIVDWFKRLPQMVMSALSNLVSMVVEPFEDALDAIGEMWKPEKWIEIGTSVIEGILEGIKKSQDKVLEMLKSLAADAIQAAKEAIGFGSPATEFMPIGESMVQGMLLGAKKEKFAKKFVDDLNMGGIARSLGTGGGQWRNFRNIIKNQIGADFDQLMTSGMSAAQIIDKIQKVAAKFNFPPSFASEFAMANGLIEHLTSSVTEFQKAMRLENMGKMVQIGGQFASIGQSLVDMLKPVDDGRVQTLQDFLSGKTKGRMFAHPLTGALEEMVVLQQDGLEIALNRTLAQQELNRLLEEQRRQEELITQQKKSQEQLGFLQQQIELIKMGKELGGNLFQGITFGLDASVDDLLAATNAITMALVDQINNDLQISSPSKVMFDKFKNQVGGGMIRGLMAVKPMLSGVVGSMLSPLAGDYSRTTNNYFSQTVNTRAEQSSVIGDFRTMQLMAG